MNDSEKFTVLHQDFDDVDDYIEKLKSWDNDISQLMPGLWLGCQSTISAGQYQYHFFSHNVKSLHKAHQNQQGFNFLIPLSSTPLSYLGYDFDGPVISCTPCGQPLSVISPVDFQGVSLFINYEYFNFLLDHRYDSPVNCPSLYDTSFLNPTSLQLRQLTNALIHIRETFKGEQLISLDKQQWLLRISETTVASILIAIIANESNQGVKNRPALFTQAVTLVLDNLDSVPTVAELSQELGITTRYLQQLFQSILNLTPKQFINRCRLNQARKQFSVMRYKRGNISDVANSLGYWHMSGFSQDFRRFFGVTPSEFVVRDKV